MSGVHHPPGDRRGHRHDRNSGDLVSDAPLPVAEPRVLGARRQGQPQAVAAWNKSTGSTAPSPRSCSATSDNLIRLQFGCSYKLGQSVSALFKENAGRSAYLTLAALILSLAIAIPLGILQAVRRNRSLDYTVHDMELRSVLDALVLPRADPDPAVFARHRDIFPPVVATTSRPRGRRSRTRYS